MKYKIEDERNLIRIDKYLIDKLDASRSNVQDMIKQKLVLVNNKEVKKNYVLKMNDEVEVLGNLKKETNVLPEKMDLDIIYEDDDVIVINKPSGMVVHPVNGHYSGTLVNGLLAHTNSLSGVNGSVRPGIVHRIDKETSGLLVVAKNDLAHQKLSEQFFDHSVERTYYAVVYGVPNPLEGIVSGNIGRSRFDRKKRALLKTGGKHAVTHYKTLDCFKHSASLVQCNLETGRTHQIRVHLSSIGCSLIGDKLYQQNHKTALKFPLEVRRFLDTFPRQALHAATLGFIHPRSGKKMLFQTDYPEDFKELLQVLHNM